MGVAIPSKPPRKRKSFSAKELPTQACSRGVPPWTFMHGHDFGGRGARQSAEVKTGTVLLSSADLRSNMIDRRNGAFSACGFQLCNTRRLLADNITLLSL